MILTAGFHHPKHGFIFIKNINSEQVTDWLSYASFFLLDARTVVLDNKSMNTHDLTPVITFDMEIDRIFLDRQIRGNVPDHDAYSHEHAMRWAHYHL
jgi:hypothetical protein